MKKILTIDGRDFTILKAQHFNPYFKRLTLDDCYERPSVYKFDIYNSWMNWGYKNGVEYFGISSYNCMMFTLSGLYTDNNGQQYYMYITKTRQELTPII